MLTINRDKWSIWLPNPDWRAYANDIKEELDRSMVFTSCPPLAMKYYLKDQGDMVTPMQIAPSDSLDNIRAYIKEEFQNILLPDPNISISRSIDIGT
jgi:hypothetical protein